MKITDSFKNSLQQAGLILIVSFAIGALVNTVRSNGIPWLAPDLEEISVEDTSWMENMGFGISTINLAQAKELFDKNVIFIDARAVEYYEEGHIAGAMVNSNFRELMFNLDSKQTRFDPIVLYCDGGDCQLSEELGYDLEAEGFSTIYVFSGGWEQWVEAKLPILP